MLASVIPKYDQVCLPVSATITTFSIRQAGWLGLFLTLPPPPPIIEVDETVPDNDALPLRVRIHHTSASCHFSYPTKHNRTRCIICRRQERGRIAIHASRVWSAKNHAIFHMFVMLPDVTANFSNRRTPELFTVIYRPVEVITLNMHPLHGLLPISCPLRIILWISLTTIAPPELHYGVEPTSNHTARLAQW